ncbi:hypothetical protein [Acholeplasma hippikon]|uniref:Uncharacterized protein n=1 Tax=Acholeplasma hippikon TaxID=264636 RepID=A0A449BK45_9MOLU|nr:hypothetical protein [Acholeplasma hippikon]VEU82824.1 Uncharacterised protein [Acholeplasma hippikon]
MKKVWYVLMLVLVVGLVACKKTKESVDENKVAFENKMSFLAGANNYAMEVSIYDYQTLDSTIVNMVFDGNKTKYQDGSYVAFYDHSGSKTKVYTQILGGFEVKEVAKKERDFYYKFTYEMFTESNGSYLLKYDQYDALESFSLIAGSDAKIENVQLDFNTNSLDKISFSITVDGTKYSVTLTISNVGQSSVQLPEVK